MVNTYQINETQERIIYTGQNKTQIALNLTEIIQKFPICDKSNIITTANDILIRADLKTTKRISYQSIVNQIKLQWQTRRLPRTETYANPLNVNKYRSYLRDEVYAFEIVFLLKNGLQTDGFHIPGRQATLQDVEIISNNDTNNEPLPKWKVYNTASVAGFYPEWQNSTQTNTFNGQYQFGEFSYWESQEEYSCDELWGELKNKKIRHHKFPDSLITHIHDNSGNIYPIGIKIDIQQLKTLINNSDLTQEEKDNIQGFKIVRGNRANNKSISGKGILTNVLKYSKDGNPIDSSIGNQKPKTPKERAVALIEKAKGYLGRGLSNVPTNVSNIPVFLEAKTLTETAISYLNNAAQTDLSNPAYKENVQFALDTTNILVAKYYNDTSNAYYSSAQQIIESLLDIQEIITTDNTEAADRNNFYYFPNYLYNDVTGADPLLNNIIIDEDSKSRFTFQSPDTSFNQPFLGTHLKLETIEYGTANLNLVQVEKHAKYQFITIEAYTTAALTGLAVGFASGAYGFVVQVFDGTAAFTTYGLIKDIIEKVTPRKNPCHQLNSTCEFTKFKTIPNTGNKIRNNDLKNYIISGFPDLGDKYKINNWNREGSVYLKTNIELPYTHEVYPELKDSSKFLVPTYSEYSQQACVYYASLKKPFVSQYGPMYSYETIDTGFQYKLNTEETIVNIFGGDIFINKFSYKSKLPLFIDDRVGAADETDVFYNELQNVGNPKYWFSTDANQKNTVFGSIFGVRPTSFYWRDKKFFNDYGLIFLYVYGIPYFYCESEVNVDERQAFNTFEGDFYPRMGKGIPNSWLQQHTTPIVFDNTYYYNKTYSKQNKENSFTHLPLGFTEKDCETIFPYRCVFSQSQFDNPLSNRANPWLIYKPSAYFDFPQNFGKLTSLDGIENRQVLARFENKTLLYNALLTAPTSQAQVYLGQSLFNSSVPPIDYSNTDMGYVGSRHKFLLKTEYGIITVDDKRGHVFLLQGQQAKNLTDLQSGVEQFFNKNLEVRLPVYFPQLSFDNHYNFVGIHGVYDAKYNRLILTKLDYEPLTKDTKFDEQGFYIQTGVLNTILSGKKCCPPGYNLVDNLCIKQNYIPATQTGNEAPFIAISKQSNVYSSLGARIYSTFNINGTPIASPIPLTNSLWLSTSSTTGRMNNCAIWNGTSDNPMQKWVTTSFQINCYTDKTYYVGCGGDNSIRIKIGCDEIVNFNLTGGYNSNGNGTTDAFKYWHIYPLRLKKGINIIELSGWNNESIAGFGFEIYDNTSLEFQSATSINDLNIIFSTASLIGQSNTSFNYSCANCNSLIIRDSKFYCLETLITQSFECEPIQVPVKKYIDLKDDKYFKNKSFTISYDFDLQSWISFHSYLPNYYVGSSNFFISGIPGSNWKHLTNVQKYNNFYDKIEPYVVETPTAYKFQDEILQNVKDYSKVYEYTENEEFVETNEQYFNKVILYNNQQCSGILNLEPKPIRNMQAYMKYPYYNVDSKTITFTKADNFYQINTFWSLIKDRKKPLFLKTTPNLSIDKVLNQDNMDYSKRSFKKEPLRAKDLRCRFILDDKDSVRIVSQFTVNITQISYR